MAAETLKIENRIGMFCYYNTLAWEIFGATLAIVIVLATLPFVTNETFRDDKMFFAVTDAVAVMLLIFGGFAVYHLRSLAIKWISFPWENYSMTPSAWIDYVETGSWQMNRSHRAIETYAILFGLITAGVAYILVSAWFWYAHP